MQESTLAEENTRKAYALRERASARERFFISAQYYMNVTGQLEKANEICGVWSQTYLRDWVPHNFRSWVYARLGQWEAALSEREQALRLEQDSALDYSGLAGVYLRLDRLTDAKNTYHEAIAKNLDYLFLRQTMYIIGFLEGDSKNMEEQVAWAMHKPGAEDLLLSTQSDTEAYFGRLKKARKLSRLAAESAQHNDFKERAAIWQTNAAMREAELGNAVSARRESTAALEVASGRDVKAAAALTLARIGDVPRTKALAEELEKKYPSDTLLKLYWLPTINAAIELHSGNSSQASADLEAATTYELSSGVSSGGTLNPAYVRGQAYLLAHNGAAAVGEFQKVLDHRGIARNFVTGALAHLQIGRAYAMAGEAAKAKAAYQDFLTLWKDADPDIPILKQAKAEYAKLR